MTMTRLTRSVTTLAGLTLLGVAGTAAADWQMNLLPPATEVAEDIYWLHNLILGICVVIFIGVFSVMFYSLFAHRKSRGAKPATFHESTTVEVVWTVIPFLILIGMAIPSTAVLIKMEDTTDADMTVKITGYQWNWHYEYLDHEVGFFSRLATPWSQIVGDEPKGENYLLEVDNPLVLPVGQKVRFLITAADVIHAWWVPEFGVKKDAIPGFINAVWATVDRPGTYRGQCAELCGKDHAYMPIVVEAVSQEEFAAWVEEQRGEQVAAIDVEPTALFAADVAPAPEVPVDEEVAEIVAEAVEEADTPEELAEAAVEAAATDEEADAAPAEVEVAAETETETDANGNGNGEMSMDDLMSRGEQVYAQCIACHGADGGGVAGAFPPITGSEVATGPLDAHIDLILNGVPGTAMVAFGGQLNDTDLAAVITYQRNALGNDVGDMAQPADVAARR